MVDGLVESTERLYRTLFATAVGYGVATAALGLILAPLNAYDHAVGRSLGIGAALLAVMIAAFARRRRLFALLRDRPELLLGFAALGVRRCAEKRYAAEPRFGGALDCPSPASP